MHLRLKSLLSISSLAVIFVLAPEPASTQPPTPKGRATEDVRQTEPGVKSGDPGSAEVSALRARVSALEKEVGQLRKRVQSLPAVKHTAREGKADDPTITRRDLDLIWGQIDEILRVLPKR